MSRFMYDIHKVHTEEEMTIGLEDVYYEVTQRG